MRIIAGKYKGFPIKFPNSKLVRPTTDRNKESIFNYLNNLIDFENLDICDIYAGSGSLGLEALSRGAANVTFVEKSFKVAQVLKDNVAKLKSIDMCKVIISDAVRFSSRDEHEIYDLILADPPFFKDDIHQVVTNLKDKKFLSEIGILLIERSVQTRDKDIEAFAMEPVKKMGDSLIYIFK
jgi:16S rRNA (guanine966-N2)-methyltransferase